MGKPGRPYGRDTTPKQHDTKRHTDISPVDKQNQGACAKLPLPAEVLNTLLHIIRCKRLPRITAIP